MSSDTYDGLLNEDWQAGDLAECVHDDWLDRTIAANPSKGDVLRVVDLYENTDQLGRPVFCLTFEGKPWDLSWTCTAFRKLRPSLTACTDGWAEWLQGRVTPKVDA